MAERSLLVGFDLCEDYSQISCYNEKTFEPVCLGVDKDEKSQYIPTVLAVNRDTKEWFFGEEAKVCAKEGQGIKIDNILQKIVNQEDIVLYGTCISPVTILTRFFKKTLRMLKEYYPDDTILKLVVTVAAPNKRLLETIFLALEGIGIYKDRAIVLGHKQSYLYYALGQKKELWLNDVGLFEFTEQGLKYYQITIDRRKSPMVIGVMEKNFTETLSYEMTLQKDKQEQIGYVFENIARSAIHKQIVSTLYMIGKGFDGEWATSALQKLCVGRRVFKGKNLYVKGACYAARELSGQGRLSEFIFLDEDMLISHVSTNVYTQGQKKEMVLVKAGTPWFDAKISIDLIPDEEEELLLMFKNVISKETAKHLIPFEIRQGRPNRMTRLNVRIQFADIHTCIVTVKDKGFGKNFATSNRKWERIIHI